MTVAVFSEDEKVRIRHHLGYTNVGDVYTLVGGVPAAVQTQFMIEGALQRLRVEAAPKARELLCRLDSLERDYYCGAADFASVNKIDNIEINPKRRRELGGYYRTAMQAMGNLLSIVPNPWDQRDILNVGSINVPVR
jgi:hypothetical protein